MPEGFGLTKATSLEIITAYGVKQVTIPAVTSSPGWHVIGEFFMPKTASARLDVLGLVSASGLTLNARLFDMTTQQPLALVSTTSQTLARKLSGKHTITGQRSYQLQVECVGATGDNKFAVVGTATISD